MNEMQSRTDTADQKLVGIDGWLILPALGLLIAPVMMVVDLVKSLSIASDVADAGYGGILALEMVVEAGLLVFIVYAATQFFGKRSSAPFIMISLYVAQVVAEAILLEVELATDAGPFAVQSGEALVRSVIVAAIWIPYFRTSKRVRSTFVR